MLHAKLEKKVGHGEGQRIEFKEKTTNITQLLVELVAFLNADGGELFVGVKDSGKIIGLPNYEGEKEYLIGKIETEISPIPDYHIEMIPLSKERAVIAVSVSSGSNKPYGVNIKGRKWPRVYKRILDESRELGPVERTSLSLSGVSKKGKLKLRSKELAVIREIEKGEATLKSIQSSLKLNRNYLVRQLALFHSRGLIKIKTSRRDEGFTSSGVDPSIR